MPSEWDRALTLQDTAEWKIQWDYHVKSEAGGAHSIISFLGQVAHGATQQPSQDGLALLTVLSVKRNGIRCAVFMGMNQRTFPDYRAVAVLWRKSAEARS
jgi:hypothetical protein